MKKHILKLTVFFLAIMLSAGCKKEYLETSPTNAVSPANALSTPANMMVALNGVHRTMYSQSILGDFNNAGDGYIMPWMDFAADDAQHSDVGNGWFRGIMQWIVHTNATSGDVEWLWYHYYHIIGNVNAIINASEGMTEDKVLSNVLGQAKAYRAWAHFNLVRLFAKNYIHGNPATDLGVPIMLATAAPYEGLPRATVAEVYAQIEKDITESIAHFQNASARVDNSHLSLKVAQGLAARIALTKGDWASAATYANAARTGYNIMNETEYKSGFNTFTGTEVMWGSRIVPDQTTYYYAWFYYIGTNFNGTQNRLNPKFINNTLFHKIPDTDYRKKMWLEKAPNSKTGWTVNDPNYATKALFDAARATIITNYKMTTAFRTHPYMSVKFLNKTGPTIDPDDLIFMRVSEMYLTEAEALARNNQDAEAAAVLFSLISKRDPAYVLSTNTGTDLIEEIKTHRRIELWGEGHRWFDLLRYDEGFDRTGTGADQTLYQAGFAQAKPSLNPNWVFKIPQKEIDANPNINAEHQNPSSN